MVTKKKPKTASEYFCKNCHFHTCKKSNYDTHILTAKHLKVTNVTECSKQDDDQHKCKGCGKVYKSRMGLWRHNKACSETLPLPIESNINVLTTSTILNIIKENHEFKTMLIEQQKENKELMNKMMEITQNQLTVPTTTNIVNNTTTHNNNNQKFNLNFFLNETCKDAMNIQDFIDNIRISFEDLNMIGDAGFVNGLSDIFIKKLRDMEVEKRPIHCTDSKRDTIYLKENNIWEKDDKENNRIRGFIEKVEYKNVAALHKWCEENPDAKINNTPNNILRDKIFMQTLQGDDNTRNKIIKNISKEVILTNKKVGEKVDRDF
jgi:hypothetical protein